MWALGAASYAASSRTGRQAPEADVLTARRRELAFLGWASAALASSYGAGMSAGLALFVLFYLRWQSGRSLQAAVAVSALTWIVLQSVQVSLLRVRLFEGVWADWVTWLW